MKRQLLIILLIPLLIGCMHKSGQVNKSPRQDSTKVVTDSGKSLNEAVKTQEYDLPNCYIDTIVVKDNKFYITLEYIAFLGGQEAVAAAKKDGYPVEVDTVINGDTVWHVPDDYYIAREDTTRSTFVVSDKVEISLLYGSENESGKTIHDLLDLYTKGNILKTQPFIIKEKDGVITKITEYFVP
ncbi:MAG: hypothetical protein ABSA76_14935 [Bacteroidales bacterium]